MQSFKSNTLLVRAQIEVQKWVPALFYPTSRMRLTSKKFFKVAFDAILIFMKFHVNPIYSFDSGDKSIFSFFKINLTFLHFSARIKTLYLQNGWSDLNETFRKGSMCVLPAIGKSFNTFIYLRQRLIRPIPFVYE